MEFGFSPPSWYSEGVVPSYLRKLTNRFSERQPVADLLGVI